MADDADREGSQNRNGTATREADKRDAGQKEAKTDDRSSDAGDQNGDQQGSGGQADRGSEHTAA